MTKAVFYQHLGQPVPLEYRHMWDLVSDFSQTKKPAIIFFSIRSAIDAKVDHTGMITLIRDRPERIFLQTDVYQDIIGITSTKKGSTLKSMSKELDLVPYTPEENNTIWDYILTKARGPGKTQRIKEKMTGWIFWQEFLDVVHTKRTWKSLSQQCVLWILFSFVDHFLFQFCWEFDGEYYGDQVRSQSKNGALLRAAVSNRWRCSQKVSFVC